jgi:hypothetical protein
MTQLCSDYELLFLSCQQIVYTSFILFYFLLQSFQINGNYLAASLQKFISSLTLIYLSTIARQPPVGWGLFFVEDSRSHSDTPHSVGLLWTGEQLSAETSDRHPFPRRDSNPQSQKASRRRPWPWTARSLGSATKSVLWISQDKVKGRNSPADRRTGSPLSSTHRNID